MLNKSSLVTISTFLGLTAASAFAYVCPHSYTVINLGDTKAEVRAACGKPTNVQKQQQQVSQNLQFTRWIYTLPNSQLKKINKFTPKLVVVFQNQQVKTIRENVPANSQGFACYRNNQIQVGNNAFQVRSRCGNPTYIRKSSVAMPSATTVTQWTYNFGEYFPKPVFTFEGNKLVNIK